MQVEIEKNIKNLKKIKKVINMLDFHGLLAYN